MRQKDQKVLRIVRKISLPITFSSLVIIIIYHLYESILNTKNLSTVNSSNTFLLLSYIIDKIFIISIVTTCLSLVSYTSVRIIEIRSNSNEDTIPEKTNILQPSTDNKLVERGTELVEEGLKLVGVSIVESSKETDKPNQRSLPLPRIDFKLRNIGKHVAFIKRAEFKILDVGIIYRCRQILPTPANVSCTYDVEISPEMKGSTIEVDISQSVASNEVDRFQFVIGHRVGGMDIISVWYYLKVFLIYNETDQVIETKPIVLQLPSTVQPAAYFDPGGPSDIKCIKQNKELIARMSQYDAIMNTSAKATITEIEKRQLQEVIDFLRNPLW